MRKVLYPTDFSGTSDAALATACHWTRKLDAELHVLHVLEAQGFGLEPFAGAVDGATAGNGVAPRMREHAQAELDTRVRLARHQEVPAVVPVLVTGMGAAPEILDYAEAKQVDLIATATHGRRGVRRLLLGSVAEEVVQRSSCPVLAIADRNHSSYPLSPQRILVAVDLSAHSEAQVAHAKHLAALFGGEIDLLHALAWTPLPAYYEGVGMPRTATDSPRLEREARAALEALYARAAGPSGPFGLHVVHGVVVEEILRFAAENSTDLVVVASHGLTGASHLFMGSVAERVVRQSPCPVLTVKSFGTSLFGGKAPKVIEARPERS